MIHLLLIPLPAILGLICIMLSRPKHIEPEHTLCLDRNGEVYLVDNFPI